MAEGGRPRQETNVSFTTFGGSAVGASVVPPYGGTSRMDCSTSIGMDGRIGRSGTNRSRSQASVRADSYRRSEGRRMSQDTRRYMQAAAASTQTTVQQLLARLQSYQIFQPFLSHQLPYTPTGDRAQSRASVVALARQRSMDRTFSVPQLWQVINSLLDTSVAHLLQHNAEGHFIVTLQSTLGQELMSTAPKMRTVIESRASGAAATSGAAVPPSGGRQLSAASMLSTHPTISTGLGDANLLIDRWAAEHPDATAADIAVQRKTWDAFEDKRRRDNHAFYLKAMQAQLNALQAEESGGTSCSLSGRGSHSSDSRNRLFGSRPNSAQDVDNAAYKDGPLDAPLDNDAALDARIAPSEKELQEERERQRALWLSFQEELSAPVSKNHYTATVARAFSDAPRIVSSYLESSDLHDWLKSSWPHRTHRHESAALRIQCAYRAYRARCEVRVMRYARRQSFVIGLAAEKDARRVWDLALQVQVDDSKAVSGGGDDTIRSLQFFIDKINAVVTKRRARKQALSDQDAEIRDYAAVSVQRVYRGHRARVYVNELRHPEIVAARRRALEERSAVAIQTSWRRHREERTLHRMQQAACTLQRAYRCHAARRLLAERRRLYVMEEVTALQRFSVRRVEGWYGCHLARRNALAAAHLPELRTLQRVSRGYLGRKHIGAELRFAELRVVGAVVARRRRTVLDARAATAMKKTLAEEKAAQQNAALREDAAVTIQRALRSRRAAMASKGQRE